MSQQIFRVALAGGISSGKTELVRNLPGEIPGTLITISEVATNLLRSGFYRLGRLSSFSSGFMESFIGAIIPTQHGLEQQAYAAAQATGRRIILCDRSLVDPAVFWQKGIADYERTFDLKVEDTIRRYDLIFVLETIAMTDSSLYGRRGNRYRFHSAEQALELQVQFTSLFQNRSNVVFLPAGLGIGGVRQQIAQHLRHLCNYTSKDCQ